MNWILKHYFNDIKLTRFAGLRCLRMETWKEWKIHYWVIHIPGQMTLWYVLGLQNYKTRNLLYKQFSWPTGHFITLKHYPPLLLKFTLLGLSSTLGKGGPWTTSSFNVAEESKQQGPPIVRIHPDHGREAKIGTSTQSFLMSVLWLQIFVQVNYFWVIWTGLVVLLGSEPGNYSYF